MRKTLFLLILTTIMVALAFLFLSSNVCADGTPSLTLDGTSSHGVAPGEHAIYNVDVENTGDADDFDISLSYSNPDGNWTVYTSESNLSLDTNETGRFYLNVLPHDNETTPEDNDSLPVTVEVTARTGGANDSLLTNTSCHYNISYGAEFTFSSQLQHAYPDYNNPDTLTFKLQITNTGTNSDDFRCEVNSSYTKVNIHDWATVTEGAIINSLGVGGVANVTVEVTVRPYDQDHEATPGEKNFWILVYSKTARNNGKEKLNETTDLFRATVQVVDYFYVTVDPLEPTTPTLQVGESATFEIKVENLGNTQDTFTMVKDGDAPTNGEYSTWQEFDNGSVAMEPDSFTTVNMTITVKAGDDAVAWFYRFYFHAKSQGDASVESQKKYNSIEIEEFFGVEVAVPTKYLNVEVGDVGVFPIQITNEGNSRVRITLINPDLALEDWDFYWTDSAGSTTAVDTTGDMDPDATKTMYLKVVPPSNSSKAMTGEYVVPFKVKSGTGDETVYANENVTVNIEALYDINVRANIDSADIEPGEMTRYTIKVENRGNTWDNFSYEIIDPDQLDWASFDEENVTKVTPEDQNGYNETTRQFTLAPWQFVNVPFIVKTPEYSDENDDAEADREYKIDVKFTSRADSAVNQKQKLITTVEQVYDVAVTVKDDIPKVVKLKESGYAYVDFILEVKNLGNGDDTFIIKVPAGELDGEKEDWLVDFRIEGSLVPSSGFKLDTLTKEEITVEVGADDGTKADLCELDIDVSSKGDTDVKKTTTLQLDCEKTRYGVKIEGVNDKNQWNQTANPADMPRDGIEYRFNIQNIGEREDSFFLKVETNTGTGTYRDWEILFDTKFGPEPQMRIPSEIPDWGGRKTMDEEEEVEIKVFVKPPEDEDASGNDLDKFGDLEISAESEQDSQQSDSIFFRLIVIRPDLRIAPDDIFFDTREKIDEGDTVELEITIHNDGQAESGKFDVWVYEDEAASLSGIGGTVGLSGLLIHEMDVESIDPRRSHTLDIDWEIEWGKHELYVYVDKPIMLGIDKTEDRDKGDVTEEIENNNDAKLKAQFQEYIDFRPWIEVMGIDWDKTPEEGENITITVTVYNNASHNAVASYGESRDDADMYIKCKAGGRFLKPKNGSGSAGAGYKVSEKLEPDDTLEVEFEWKIEDDAGTTVTIKPYIDYEENKNSDTTPTIPVRVWEGEHVDDFSSETLLGDLAFTFLAFLLVGVGFFLGSRYTSGKTRAGGGQRPRKDKGQRRLQQKRPGLQQPPPPLIVPELSTTPEAQPAPELQELIVEDENVVSVDELQELIVEDENVVSVDELQKPIVGDENVVFVDELQKPIVEDENVVFVDIPSSAPQTSPGQPGTPPQESQAGKPLPERWLCPKCGNRIGQAYESCFVCGVKRP